MFELLVADISIFLGHKSSPLPWNSNAAEATRAGPNACHSGRERSEFENVAGAILHAFMGIFVTV